MRLTGSPELSWRRLLAVVNQLMNDRASALFRSQNPDYALWDLHAQLLAVTANAVRVANWQRSDDAANKTPKHYPDAILPPWDEREVELPEGSTRFGRAHMTLEEADEWLGW